MSQPVSFSVGIKRSRESEKVCENNKKNKNPFSQSPNTDPFENIMFRYLSVEDQHSFSLVSKECRDLTLSRRKKNLSKTVKEIQLFRDVLLIEDFDEKRSDDLNYCNNYICRFKEQIKSIPCFSEILIQHNGNFTAIGQEIKDQDLICVFKKIALYSFPQRQNTPNHEKAEAIRTHLESLPENAPLFQIRALSLSNLQLTSIPPEISRFVQLRELYLSRNQIRIIPPTIGRLVELRYLNIADNPLQAIASEIGNLVQLQDLRVSNRQLRLIPPEINRHIVRL